MNTFEVTEKFYINMCSIFNTDLFPELNFATISKGTFKVSLLSQCKTRYPASNKKDIRKE